MGSDRRAEDLGPQELREASAAFFAGGHDVIVARRHYTDEGTTTADIAGSAKSFRQRASGVHGADRRFNGSAASSQRTCAICGGFPGRWLKPAGASFDHLHKQVVAIDEVGADNESVLPKAVLDPGILIGGDPTLR